jgi:hypothetical protein
MEAFLADGLQSTLSGLESDERRSFDTDIVNQLTPHANSKIEGGQRRRILVVHEP